MKQSWNGEAYKELLWKAATATTVPYFQIAMEELKAFSKPCYDWLVKIPPQHWARSHFSGTKMFISCCLDDKLMYIVTNYKYFNRKGKVRCIVEQHV